MERVHSKMAQESTRILVSPQKSQEKRVAGVIVVVVVVGFFAFLAGQSIGYNRGLEDRRFDFYYVKPSQKYGVDNLVNELNGLVWIKDYQEGVFDCSEMSAYLEWHLENEGWHTIIAVGDSPFGSGRHAWLLVETTVDKYMPVESTGMTVVMWSDSHFDNYFKYDHSFETIQEALAYNETEFDWWQSG